MVSHAVSSDECRPVEAARAAADHTLGPAASPKVGAPSLLRRIAGGLEDAILLLLVVYLFPVAILVVGTPIALLARLALEIASRW